MRTTAAIALAIICALPSVAMDLTVDGAANCAIVVPDDAMRIHAFPAEELQ
ncbi:MAG: hypothetical protein GF393_05890, partial [Armatimonadia bacterium]|nr:hypothetical protein [Armatimonadia bacterium]